MSEFIGYYWALAAPPPFLPLALRVSPDRTLDQRYHYFLPGRRDCSVNGDSQHLATEDSWDRYLVRIQPVDVDRCRAEMKP